MPAAVAQEWPCGVWHGMYVIPGGSHSRNMLVFLLQACSISGEDVIAEDSSDVTLAA